MFFSPSWIAKSYKLAILTTCRTRGQPNDLTKQQKQKSTLLNDAFISAVYIISVPFVHYDIFSPGPNLSPMS